MSDVAKTLEQITKDSEELKAKLTQKGGNIMNNNERVYVAGPYTPHNHEHNECIRETEMNVRRAIEVGNEIAKKGHYIFVPHWSHFSANAINGFHTPNWWYEQDNTFIEHWATALYYISHSFGADRELALAKKLGLKIYTTLEEVPDVAIHP